jgi:predicted kinase
MAANNLSTDVDVVDHLFQMADDLRSGKISVADATRVLRYVRAAARRLAG